MWYRGSRTSSGFLRAGGDHDLLMMFPFFFRFLTLLFTQRMDGLSGMSGLMGSAASDRNGMAAHSDQQRATSKFATKRSFVASRDSIHLPETRTTAR
jgi:hypothetical protein